jgi:hypothetical protein
MRRPQAAAASGMDALECDVWHPKPLPWEERAKRFLKAELKRTDVGYRELAERMKKHGMQETEASIANKVSPGTFSATFMLAALIAIGAETVRLEDI